MKKMVIDRVPYQFSEGAFWGNGKMGTVMYVQNGKLCLSIDHVGLWEMREPLEDEPRATFEQILQHKNEYLSVNEKFVRTAAEKNGRTRLPALAIELELDGDVTDFFAETDLECAETKLHLKLDGGKVVEGKIWLDSCVNILYIKLSGEVCDSMKIHALGWDLESPQLEPLRERNYETCRMKQEGDSYVVRQHFGDRMSAVLCGKKLQGMSEMAFAVGIDVSEEEKEEELEVKGLALAEDYLCRVDAYYAAHEADWLKYWSRFDISVPNARLQESFDQEMYKLYCNEREDSMPITLQGVWNLNSRMPAWYGDLHNDLNVEACYWPAYKTGNVNLVRPYIDYYSKAMPRFEERAWKLFGIKDAVHVPIMMAPDGTGTKSEWCFWNTLLGAELFVAADFTWFYEYSREADTLRDKIYPFIEKVIHLYQGVAYKKEDGYWHIPFTHSPEVFKDGKMVMGDDSTFVLSCLHYLCEKMAGYAKVIGKDGSAFEEWGSQLAPVVINEKGLPLFPGMDLFCSHRHFCHMFSIFPLGTEAHNEVAERSLDTAVNLGFLEYAAFSFPYMAIMAARCGRGNMCRTMLEIYCMAFRYHNSFTVNGDIFQNGVIRVSGDSAGESADAFTLESGFFIPTALCEMFVHRIEDTVWLLMGIPDEWKECSCRKLTVEGGHRISIEQQNYCLKSVKIEAVCEETLSFAWKDGVVLTKVLKNGNSMSIVDQQGYVADVCPGDVWELEFE